MTTTTNVDPAIAVTDEAVAALAAFRTQNDQWAIADALVVAVPPNTKAQGAAFGQIRQAAIRANVKPLSVSAMRQYRDAAKAWKPADRITGCSYTAHRAALGAPSPKTLLKGVVKVAGGPQNVTVKAVNEAVEAANGVTGAKAPVLPTAAQRTRAAKAAKIVTIDWSNPDVMQAALATLARTTNHKPVAAHALKSGDVTQVAQAAINLRKLADELDRVAGVKRAPAKVVGGKKPAPKAKATAAPKAPSKGRKGRVKGL